MGVTLWQVTEEAAARRPAAVMVGDEHGRRLSFSEFRDATEQMASWLARQGVRGGDTVCWQLPTQIRTLTTMAALSRLGAVQVPLIPQYREREVAFIAGQTRPAAMLVPGSWNGVDYADLARRSVEPTAAVISLPELADLPAPADLPARSDGPDGWIFFTSGTTGNPRGAVLQTANFVAASSGWRERLGVRPTDCLTLNFPVAHVGGILNLLLSLLAGSSIACTETFGRHVLKLYREWGVTLAGAGTAHHQIYLEAQRDEPDVRLLPIVRGFIGGGAPKPASLHYAMKEAFGVGIISGYGMTEGMVLSMNRLGDEDEKLARSEGMAGPGVDLRVVSEDGSVCAPNVTGEIRVKSPTQCSGYFDDSLNEAAYDDNGYFRTGDLGFLDEDGHLIVTGRIKDVILRKGETIDAKEIEDLLALHPAVAEIAVVGVPDDERGEMVCAVVVIRQDAEAHAAMKADPTQLVTELSAHLTRQGLMRQKHPERFELYSALPRNATGKILKQELRRQLGR